MVTLLIKKLLRFDLNDETEELLITSGGKEFHFGITSRKKECLMRCPHVVYIN